VRKAAIYCRTADIGSDISLQRDRALAYAHYNGYQVVGIFEDVGISGHTVPESRPQFAAMIKAAEKGDMDMVLVNNIDQVGPMPDALDAIERLRGLGVILDILNDLKGGVKVVLQPIEAGNNKR